jgi:hypothetical protein
MDNFNTIEYQPLRTYNRCVMMFNIMEDSGMPAAVAYLKQFSDKEKTEMLDVYNQVKKYGVEEVKRNLIRTMPLQDEEEEVE